MPVNAGRIPAAFIASRPRRRWHVIMVNIVVEAECSQCSLPSARMFTMITCHRRRGREAMNAAGILPAFTGIAVHDAWAPYDTYPKITHALCNAHVLRELIAVTDHHAHSPDPKSWCWAAQVIDNLLAIKTLTQDGPIDPGSLVRHRELLV